MDKIQMLVHDHHVYIFIKMYIPRSISSSLFENVEDKLGIKKELCSCLDESVLGNQKMLQTSLQRTMITSLLLGCSAQLKNERKLWLCVSVTIIV